jgi:hypothetical protein
MIPGGVSQVSEMRSFASVMARSSSSSSAIAVLRLGSLLCQKSNSGGSKIAADDGFAQKQSAPINRLLMNDAVGSYSITCHFVPDCCYTYHTIQSAF